MQLRSAKFTYEEQMTADIFLSQVLGVKKRKAGGRQRPVCCPHQAVCAPCGRSVPIKTLL